MRHQPKGACASLERPAVADRLEALLAPRMAAFGRAIEQGEGWGVGADHRGPRGPRRHGV